MNVESSKVLLKGGADTLARDSKGRTPLDVIPEVDEEALEETERLRSLLSNHNVFTLPKWDTPTYEGVCSKVVDLKRVVLQVFLNLNVCKNQKSATIATKLVICLQSTTGVDRNFSEGSAKL